VNSFGFGGANAHVVVDDALHYLRDRGIQGNHNTGFSAVQILDQQHAKDMRTNGNHFSGLAHPPSLFVLSAADEKGIDRLMAGLASYLKDPTTDHSTNEFVQDLAFTLGIKHTTFPWKSFTLASSVDQLRQSFTQGVLKRNRAADDLSIRFVFTGQGAQWASMGAGLLDFQIFWEAIRQADIWFQDWGATWSILGRLTCALESVPHANLIRKFGITAFGLQYQYPESRATHVHSLTDSSCGSVSFLGYYP
jgi:acyl transferase domain-containing protein